MHLSTRSVFCLFVFFLVFHQCLEIITSMDVHWICTNLYMYKQVFVCSFPFLFDAYRHSVSYLCYIHWDAKINTLNICNHLATSYSHIPKTCAFDCYTNTCINISTFLEQFCLWSKYFFSQISDTKIHESFRFLFRNLEQPTLHMQTHIWKV